MRRLCKRALTAWRAAVSGPPRPRPVGLTSWTRSMSSPASTAARPARASPARASQGCLEGRAAALRARLLPRSDGDDAPPRRLTSATRIRGAGRRAEAPRISHHWSPRPGALMTRDCQNRVRRAFCHPPITHARGELPVLAGGHHEALDEAGPRPRGERRERAGVRPRPEGAVGAGVEGLDDHRPRPDRLRAGGHGCDDHAEAGSLDELAPARHEPFEAALRVAALGGGLVPDADHAVVLVSKPEGGPRRDAPERDVLPGARVREGDEHGVEAIALQSPRLALEPFERRQLGIGRVAAWVLGGHAPGRRRQTHGPARCRGAAPEHGTGEHHDHQAPTRGRLAHGEESSSARWRCRAPGRSVRRAARRRPPAPSRLAKVASHPYRAPPADAIASGARAPPTSCRSGAVAAAPASCARAARSRAQNRSWRGARTCAGRAWGLKITGARPCQRRTWAPLFEDRAAPIERRIGAAVALGAVDLERARGHARHAANACADGARADALRRAVEGDFTLAILQLDSGAAPRESRRFPLQASTSTWPSSLSSTTRCLTRERTTLPASGRSTRSARRRRAGRGATASRATRGEQTRRRRAPHRRVSVRSCARARRSRPR